MTITVHSDVEFIRVLKEANKKLGDHARALTDEIAHLKKERDDLLVFNEIQRKKIEELEERLVGK